MSVILTAGKIKNTKGGLMINYYLTKAIELVWNWPVIIICIITGLFFTARLLFVQFRFLSHTLDLIRGKYDSVKEKGQITHFQALSASLSGTIGLGNIAGVSIAIAMAGPGTVFWMWVAGFLGMATKFAECTLGTYYRKEDHKTGEMRGGPMYYIVEGLGKRWKPVSLFFAVCLAIAAIGCGAMFQVNQAAAALFSYYSVNKAITGILIAVFGGLVIIGGIKRIGKVASKIVPVMCVGYILGSITICIMNFNKLPEVFSVIISDAFTGTAAAGGVFLTVFWIGIRRAVFSNEAGFGSAPIAYAAVKSKHPVQEGLVSSIGPFIDTIIVCTATAVIIILSGNYGPEMYQGLDEYKISLDGARKNTALQNNWFIGDDAPGEQDNLQKFRDGKFTLYYKGKGETNNSIKLPYLKTTYPKYSNKGALADSKMVCDGIRFSYFRFRGDMKVHINAIDGKNIASIKLKPGEDSMSIKDPKTGKDVIITYATDYDAQKKWYSCIIHFTDEYKKLAALYDNSMSDIQIVLEPEGNSPLWAFDRFQPVTKVAGIELTILSFDSFLKGFGSIFITIAVLFFAFSTMITWSYYGEIGASYVFGKKIVIPYKWFFIACSFSGAILNLYTIINFSDLMLGLMVIPNCIALLLLSGKITGLTKEYISVFINKKST